MMSTDDELRQQLKEAGKLLSRPLDSIDELLHILDQVEKLLSVVDQSPNESMQEVLKPLMKELVKESLLSHSNVDVKVAVASCISEITRITAPDAPYSDEEMRNVFRLIVSSFENFSDKSSRSYNKRASILETVSKVRSCVIMLDLECEGLIVDMFEHFLKSVRDHHTESVFSSMMNIMVLVLEESEEISVDMLKPLLASIKNNSEGVLPVARRLGEGVLQKSGAKLRPYLIQTLKSLGDSLDNYSQVLASICEGTTAVVEHNDENALVQQQADEIKLAKESSHEALQADESKLTTALSDNVAQVVIEKAEGPLLGEIDPTIHKSPKSIISNGTLITGNEEASADQESSKKLEEAINHPDSNPTSKVDPNNSVAENLVKIESKPEQTSKRRGKKSDTIISSIKPSDSSHDHGEKEAEKLPDNEAPPSSETEKNTAILISVPKTKQSEVANASPSENASPEKTDLLKNNQELPQEEEVKAANVSSPSQNGNILYESRIKRAGRQKKKNLSQDGVLSTDVVLAKAPEGARDSGMKPQKRARKKAPVAQEDGEVTSGSDVELLKTLSKKVGTVDSGAKSEKQLDKGKKVGAGDSQAKKAKQSDKKVDAGELEAKKRKRAGKKEDESDSDAKPLKQSGKKGEKRGVIVNPSGHTTNKEGGSDLEKEPLKLSAKKGNTSSSTVVKYSSKKSKEEGSDLETEPLKLSAKQGNKSTSTVVKYSSKKNKDGKKHGRGKNVEEKDQEKSFSEYDGMDVFPKSAKGEDNLEEALLTTSKRKRSMGKDKVTIKYDGSLVGLKVKVWWPKDKTYYEGVIDSFDSTKQKHKVLYLDGEIEILNLRKQKWEILQDFSARDEEKASEVQIADGVPETQKKKRSRRDSVPSASEEKPKDSTKRYARKNSGKSVSKEAGKTRDSGNKADANVKELDAVETPESAKGKSKSGKKRNRKS